MSKHRVHSLMKEAAIGALAQELLPVFLERTHPEYHNGNVVRVHVSTDRCIQGAFETAEHFLEWREARLRASEAKLAADRERRQAKAKRKARR